MGRQPDQAPKSSSAEVASLPEVSLAGLESVLNEAATSMVHAATARKNAPSGDSMTDYQAKIFASQTEMAHQTHARRLVGLLDRVVPRPEGSWSADVQGRAAAMIVAEEAMQEPPAAA